MIATNEMRVPIATEDADDRCAAAVAAQSRDTPAEVLEVLAAGDRAAARLVAANPSITPAIADFLFGITDVRIHRALAGNPATPTPLLAKLARSQPAQVLANPAFELAILANPSFMLNLEAPALHALLRHPGLPVDVLLWCAQRMGVLQRTIGGVAQLIAIHPNATRAVLEHVARQPLARLHVASKHAYERPWLAVIDEITEVRVYGKHPLQIDIGDSRIIAAMARHGLIDASDPLVTLLMLAVGDTVRHRYIDAHPAIPIHALEQLFMPDAQDIAQGIHFEMQQRDAARYGLALRVARKEHAGELEPRENPAELATSKRSVDRARACMAIGGLLPEEHIHCLSVDSSWKVRAAVAYRPQLPEQLALRMARDADYRVRRALAQATPLQTVLRVLSQDDDVEVLRLVAGNPSSPESLLPSICNARRIRDALVTQWRSGGSAATVGRSSGRRDGSNGWMPAESATLALRSSYNSLPRFLLLSSNCCPQEILEDHSTYSSWWMRLAVARNRRTAPATLRRLRDTDQNWLVREAARELMEAMDREAAAAGAMSDDQAPFAPEAICESYMPPSTRRALAEIRKLLRAEDWESVRAGLDRALAVPEMRELLMFGMVRGKRTLRLSACSEIGRRVKHQFRTQAVEYVNGQGEKGAEA